MWKGKEMKYLLILLLFFSGCAHIRPSCDEYCSYRGGKCEYIERGSTVYNTDTGQTEERPTKFVCSYDR